MRKLDFNQLRNIPIVEVCDELGIVLLRTKSALRGACPICRHDSDRCFVVTEKINRWWCFGKCQSGGDPLELFMRVKHMTHRDAAKAMVKLFRGSS